MRPTLINRLCVYDNGIGTFSRVGQTRLIRDEAVEIWISELGKNAIRAKGTVP